VLKNNNQYPKALFNSLGDFCFDGFKIQPFRKKYFQPVYNPGKKWLVDFLRQLILIDGLTTLIYFFWLHKYTWLFCTKKLNKYTWLLCAKSCCRVFTFFLDSHPLIVRYFFKLYNFLYPLSPKIDLIFNVFFPILYWRFDNL